MKERKKNVKGIGVKIDRENKDIFEVSTEEFNNKKKLLKSFSSIPKIEYRQGDDFENKYVNKMH